MSSHVAGADELEQLQVEYVQLIEDHPPSTWSPNLFRVVNAAIRLQFGEQRPIAPNGKPRLSVVLGGVS
ncbi:hypothetical protein [Mycolicibacter sinensis]|uniref:Uncharacterized protein n=1 Tax=Mycolicibacter sinensis (strain JDM601) TaxID=875328 RepID=A0A1A2XSN5_MYCSD|nr:hypothetical protein [Mycolicibacter sinensis]OBI28178.1 hypothetical protein A5710_04015 [Mycolicibacter sinensis]